MNTMAKKILKGIKQEAEGSFSAETGYLYLVRKPKGGGYVQLDGKTYGNDENWEKGENKDSVQQKGTGAVASGEGSVAVGKNSFAGLKGFYYKHIQRVDTAGTTVNIFLSQTQVVPTISSSSVAKDTTIQPSEFLEIGDIITIVNDSKYYNVLKINNFLSNGGGIQAKWIGDASFDIIKETSPLNTDDYTVYCLAKPDAGIVDIGKGSVVIGEESKAINLGAFATGYKNTSWGNFGFTEGRENEAGYIGHAEGHHTKASGVRAHAEGYYTISNGSSSHAEGQHTRAEGQASHAEGHSNSDVSDEIAAKNNDGIINDWKNIAKFSLAKGVASHVEGKDCLALGDESHAEGRLTIANGSYSHAEGNGTTASGIVSHAEGYNTTASNDCSHAEGDGTSASGKASHAGGYGTKASGNYSHAEGQSTTASGETSHAEGKDTTASGNYSHAEGYNTTASGSYSHAEGQATTASGVWSHAEGLNTKASNDSEHAQGRCNKSNKASSTFGDAGNTIHSVGIGTSPDDRKNAFEIMQNGDAYLYGVGGYDGTNARAGTSSTLQQVLSNIGCLTEITWYELKSLRDSSGLTPGMQYRITDYNTITAQENTQSAGHQFDIIVLATDVNKLSEDARAIMHDNTYDVTFNDGIIRKCYFYPVDGDLSDVNIVDCNTLLGISGIAENGYQIDYINKKIISTAYSSGEMRESDLQYNYFQDCNLEAWKLNYCLDNDTTRFAWADNYLSPVTHQKIIAVLDSNDGQSRYIYVRYPNLDSEGQLAWACDTVGGEYIKNYVELGIESLDTSDIIYTKDENPKIGDVLDMDGETVTVVEVSIGTGVIYRMIDEWNNECPYDFKNIQFKRKISLENGYPELDIDNGTDTWVYTFAATSYHITNDSWSGLKDGSLESPYGHESDGSTGTYHDNVIDKYIILYPDDEDYTKSGKQYLNDNVFLGYWEEVGSDDPENYPYYYACCSYGCKFGLNCYNNTFGNNCYDNTFGNNCRSNTFEYNCFSNTFGNSCYDNTFGNNCRSNTFGNDCNSNTFGNSCYGNTFGNNCFSNTFGNSCYGNTFGNDCNSNTFGNSCYGNTFGNECDNIRVQKDYVYYIIVENGNTCIDITSTQTTSSSNKLRNFTIAQGVNNTTTRKTISHNTVNDTFQTVYQPANSQVISV